MAGSHPSEASIGVAPRDYRPVVVATFDPPPRVPVHFPLRRSALAVFRTEGPRLSLFVPTSVVADVSQPVELVVTFGDCAERFSLFGKVRWRPVRGQAPQLGVEFEGAAKVPVAAMIAFCAGRPLESGTAGKNRYQVTIPCRVKAGNRVLTGQITDLSASGLFVATEKRRLKASQELRVQLEPRWFGLKGDWVDAKVVWLGDKLGRPGFGARFLGATQEFLPVIKKYLPAE